MKNRITDLFQIEKPIIQAGMVWCSGWKLASSVSNAGGLGIIGAGSMSPELLQEHIQKFKANSDKPFAVNLPLLYSHVKDLINVVIDEKVPVVFTSAGNPKTWTSTFQKNGIKVVHVVSSTKFALKAEDAGVNAIVAEGFEAGGHNGREETTTFCLIPEVSKAVQIPVIAAGGVSSGKTMLAAFVLGAEGVQIGSRYATALESSAHDNFKNLVIDSKEGDTKLSLKSVTPVRLIKNEFFETISNAEKNGATPDELKEILGKGRSKKGIFEGDLINGELEIGQTSSSINKVESAKDITESIWEEFKKEIKKTALL